MRSRRFERPRLSFKPAERGAASWIPAAAGAERSGGSVVSRGRFRKHQQPSPFLLLTTAQAGVRSVYGVFIGGIQDHETRSIESS
jgi:hypothetical protein